MKELRRRRMMRYRGFDYSSSGAYFVTICTKNREELFGEILGQEIMLNDRGMIVLECWNDLIDHYASIELDECVVMPNHFHGIIWINDAVGAGFKPAPTEKIHSLSEYIRALKTFSSRKIGFPVWQRNYYERIIRSDTELFAIRKYIMENPLRWVMDPERCPRFSMR